MGAPTINESDRGKKLFNSALFLSEGSVQSLHHKTLLPTYDIFDEYRHFEPNNEFQVVDYNGKKYLRLTIGNKKEADQYGKTHSVWLDEYKPEEKVEQSSKPEPNLPF